MTTFQRGKEAELKNGWVNGHRVSTAHIKGTDVYTVKVDKHAEVTLTSAEALAQYLYEMTKPQGWQQIETRTMPDDEPPGSRRE